MLMIPAALIGALIGLFRIQKKGGTWLDKIHAMAIYAIAFFIASMFVTIILDWFGWL
ncbi:MAG: hypothetical protein COB84_10315 [Rhodobacteraceae bacterium]|nr:MAG: hypothetical protein COB84_10315 [Paracoccaceae bacterium]